MTRTGLYIALALAVLVGGIFGIYPELDLRIARIFVDWGDRPDFTFSLRLHPAVWWLREIGLWISAILVTPAVIALVWKLVRPDAPMIIPGRAAILLVATLAIGPGLVTNVVLKDFWSRPRPVDVTQFGGKEGFVPWWDPRGDCDKNCSFVSGDVSGAYWTMAAAAVSPPQWRALAYAGALTLGTAMGALRMMAGGHFFTDVFFAGFFTFLVIWILYGLIYRWPSTRTTDRAVEKSLEAMSPQRVFGGEPRKRTGKRSKSARARRR
jgi:membrane-associated PAP2 superfamily phosphatase